MSFKFTLKDDDSRPRQQARQKPRTVVKIDPFDLAAAKQDFEQYRHKIEQMKSDAMSFDVTDPDTNDLAVTMMGQARQISKAITQIKDKKLRPHNEFRTKLISFAKTYTHPLEDVVRILKGKTEQYAYQQIVAQRAKEKAEREAAEKRQRELDAQAEAAGVETIALPQMPVDQDNKVQTRTETGSSLNITLVWHGTIVNPEQVPREYCVPDQKLIDKAVAAGVREIAGVEIKEVPKSRLMA